MVYGQSNGLGAPSYRQQSPASAQFTTSSPGYRVGNGYSSHNPMDPAGMPHPRQASISSVSSTDYGTSPTMSHAGSRNNSIYSLDGQMGSLGMGSAGVDPATGQPLYSGGMARYPGVSNAPYVDRRFSLDERSRPAPGNAGVKASTAAAPSGRSWPWGQQPAQNASMHGRASYDYGATAARAASGSYPTGYEAFSHAGGMADMPSRLRSMSSSAISGRSHPYGYPGAGSAANAAAAMGLTQGDMLQMDAHGHPIQGVGLVGPQVGPGGGSTRRAKFKRSREGCLVCRKRKVKCSQDGTPCKQCRIGKRDCYYDDSPPKRKRKGKNGSSAAGDAGSATNSDSSKQGLGNGSFSKPHLAPGSGSYDSYPQLPPPPGVAFSMPFGQSNAQQHHSHSGHSAEDAPGFGSSGWPVAPGEAHGRASFDASGSLASDSHDSQRSGSFASAYDHRLSQGHVSSGIGGPGGTGAGAAAANGGWYDPVTEQHSRPYYGSEAAAAHS